MPSNPSVKGPAAVLASVLAIVGTIYGLSGPSAATPEITVKGEHEVAAGVQIVLHAEGNARSYHWVCKKSLNAFKSCENRELAFATLTPDVYEITLIGIGEDGTVAEVIHEVKVGKGPTPTPIDPTPVDPTPTPIPGKISVVVIEEVDDRTPEFSMLQGSVPLREYLNTHTEKAASGLPSWYWGDDDTTVAKMPAWTQTAMSQPRTGLPWIVVLGPGGKGVLYSGPIPTKDVGGKKTYPLDDTINLLKKWGGQ